MGRGEKRKRLGEEEKEERKRIREEDRRAARERKAEEKEREKERKRQDKHEKQVAPASPCEEEEEDVAEEEGERMSAEDVCPLRTTLVLRLRFCFTFQLWGRGRSGAKALMACVGLMFVNKGRAQHALQANVERYSEIPTLI